MSSIKKLAGETVWYGASSIFAKFFVQLLTPYLTLEFRGSPDFGKMSLVYAMIPFINMGALFGLDYAYFRFIVKKDTPRNLYSTLLISLITTTIIITAVIIYFRAPVASALDVAAHPGYITLSALIIGLDALSALPLAKLRHEGRPRKFAFIRATGVIVYVAFIFFFLSVCPHVLKAHPNSVMG
ncbi:MAG TPA: oligosaccharide flippase family protein, partial [Puia sp.]|nr:oligosaccharide flippase family protein [Puia sp.]